jgi:hypothetical protein
VLRKRKVSRIDVSSHGMMAVPERKEGGSGSGEESRYVLWRERALRGPEEKGRPKICQGAVKVGQAQQCISYHKSWSTARSLGEAKKARKKNGSCRVPISHAASIPIHRGMARGL